MIRRVIGLIALAAAIIAAGYGIARGARAVIDATAAVNEGVVPTTQVKRSAVVITVSARGELQGGGARPMVVPRAGTAELPITFLRDTGELVEEGDVVAEFDSSGQEFNLLEAEADLEEARQRLLQAEAQSRVDLEQARLSVVTAEADLRIAELDQLDNEFAGAIEQRQKEIALERARNRYEQAQHVLAHRESTAGAGIETERAAMREAQAKADTARQTMASLSLKAPTSGYVELAPNTAGLSIIFTGMQIPTFQLGDSARPGQTVAVIPDMSRWEVSAQIPETDRAFLEVGQEVIVRPMAMPGREFRGRVSVLGGATGSAWNRSFNCRIALLDPDESLRPGMTVDLQINIETLDDVLWIPSQAVFDREGRRFVYRSTPEGYITHEVTLVQRTESQSVVTGIDEGAVVALAEPGQQRDTAGSDGPLGALSP